MMSCNVHCRWLHDVIQTSRPVNSAVIGPPSQARILQCMHIIPLNTIPLYCIIVIIPVLYIGCHHTIKILRTLTEVLFPRQLTLISCVDTVTSFPQLLLMYMYAQCGKHLPFSLCVLEPTPEKHFQHCISSTQLVVFHNESLVLSFNVIYS